VNATRPIRPGVANGVEVRLGALVGGEAQLKGEGDDDGATDGATDTVQPTATMAPMTGHNRTRT